MYVRILFYNPTHSVLRLIFKFFFDVIFSAVENPL